MTSFLNTHFISFRVWLFVLGSTEKPVISEKPNISKKPDIVTRSNTKPSDSTEGCAMKSSDSSKTTSKPQKITKPYEEVIMKPVGLGVKPSLQTSNTEAIRLVDRPPMPVPMAQSPSNESDLYSEVTAEDKCASHQDDGEYVDCYAATNRKEKWSLQHVALAGVTSASSPDDVICNGEISLRCLVVTCLRDSLRERCEEDKTHVNYAVTV